MTRTESLRQLIRTGRKTASELAFATGICEQLVVPLLKHDIAQGRVKRVPTGDRIMYAWVDQEPLAIRDAVRLLEARGYRVEAP